MNDQDGKLESEKLAWRITNIYIIITQNHPADAVTKTQQQLI